MRYRAIPKYRARRKLRSLISIFPRLDADKLFDLFTEWIFEELININLDRLNIDDISEDFNNFALDFSTAILNE